MLHNWSQLYANALADVSDICEWKAKDQNGFYPQSEAAARQGQHWVAIPHCITPGLITYRRSWFAEVGAMEPLHTLDGYRKIGTALKKKGRSFGQRPLTGDPKGLLHVERAAISEVRKSGQARRHRASSRSRPR